MTSTKALLALCGLAAVVSYTVCNRRFLRELESRL